MKKQLINSIIFLFIIFIVSCDNNVNKDIKIDSHLYDDDPEFELLWERYLESSGGGWKDNLNGRFSWDDSYALEGLLYAFRADQKLVYLDKFIERADIIIEHNDIYFDFVDTFREDKLLYSWGTTRYTNDGSHHIFTIHDAMISSPLIAFLNVISNYNLPKRYLDKAKIYLAVVLRNFEEIHAKDFIEIDENSGFFQDPYFESLGFYTPLNQFVRSALLCIELYNATNDESFKTYAIKTANYLKSKLIYEEDLFYWAYGYYALGTTNMGRADDLSHASIVAQFIITCYENNIVFTKQDIDKLINLFFTNIFKNDTFSINIDGTGIELQPEEIGVKYFVLLSKYNTDIYYIINNWYQNQTFELDETTFLNHFGSKLILWFGLLKYLKP